MKDPEVVIMDYVRHIADPIQEILFVREVLAIAKERERLIQVSQTCGEPEGFESHLLRIFGETWGDDFYVWRTARDGRWIWVIATGPDMKGEYERMIQAVMGAPKEPEMPIGPNGPTGA